MKCGALGCSIGAVYSVHHLRNYLTAESLDEKIPETVTQRASDRKKEKMREKEGKASPECVTPLLSMCE